VSGLKLDAGKPRWDLLPWRSVGAMVDVLTYGAAKYAPNNWKAVENAHERYLSAALRHLAARQEGQRYDPESGLPHLAHAACCIVFMLAFELGEAP